MVLRRGRRVAARLVLRAARLLALDGVDEHDGGADDGRLEDDRAAHVERRRRVRPGAQRALDCAVRVREVRGACEGQCGPREGEKVMVHASAVGSREGGMGDGRADAVGGNGRHGASRAKGRKGVGKASVSLRLLRNGML